MPPDNSQSVKKDTDSALTTSGPVLSTEKTLNDEKNSHPVYGSSPFGEAEKSSYTPNPNLKTLRTYQGDLEETIGKKKESVVSIIAAEQRPEKKTVLNIPESKDRNIFMSHGVMPLLGLILFIAGAGTLFIIYYFTSLANTPVAVTTNTSVISYSDKKDVEVGTNIRGGIIQSISDQKTSFKKLPGSVLYLHFTANKSDISSNDFFSAIAPSSPQNLIRSFEKVYMAGIYVLDTNKPFVIIASDNYGQTFSGMLQWESNMGSDLSALFAGVGPALASGHTMFSDDTFNNQDVRVLRDSSGSIVLMYGFINKNILIITENEVIFQAIATKYINSKLVK